MARKLRNGSWRSTFLLMTVSMAGMVFLTWPTIKKAAGRHAPLRKGTLKSRNVAATLGALYEFEAYSRVHPYLGLGLGAAYVHFHNQSSHVKRSVNRWGVAFLAKSGVKFDVTGNFFLDLFVDYSYYLFNFKKGHCRNNVNTGGFLIGGGIGYRF